MLCHRELIHVSCAQPLLVLKIPTLWDSDITEKMVFAFGAPPDLNTSEPTDKARARLVSSRLADCPSLGSPLLQAHWLGQDTKVASSCSIASRCFCVRGSSVVLKKRVLLRFSWGFDVLSAGVKAVRTLYSDQKLVGFSEFAVGFSATSYSAWTVSTNDTHLQITWVVRKYLLSVCGET